MLKMKALLLLCYVVLVTSVPLKGSSEDKCGYKGCPKTEKGVLNVHIVPHTHDDVGWLKTVDQYYYGSRNNIQKAGVQYILDSVIKELWEDPKRRFIYVETAFFWKWWSRQSKDVRGKVRTLVSEGRLQFVGGAWSMNDEAAAHYHSTIDQFTWGLSKLRDTFGPCVRPRVGWQIDPFGHSREMASLLAAMDYDGLFLGRIDYQDKMARKAGRAMEMIWRGDDDLGKPSDIFTGVLYNTYSPPPGFCFDVLCQDEPIIDDPNSPMFNVDNKVNEFIEICKNMSKSYITNNVLVTMGEDFQYQQAEMWYKNLDKLIEVDYLSAKTVHGATELPQVTVFLDYVNHQSQYYRTNNVIITMGGDFTYQDANMYYKSLDKLIQYTNLKSAKDGLGVKLFYSTPNCYLKAVKEANPTLPTKQDDFFPYASDSTAYWTGYFTSRPTTKFFEREGGRYLQMAKQLQALAGLNEHNMFVLDELKSAMGIMQHHDAITGTEKEHVAHDYERILNQAIDDSLNIARQAFNKVVQGDPLKPPLYTYDRCRFNESSCATSEESDNFVVTLYNPLAWKVNEPVRIPVLEGNYEVYAPNGDKIKSQLVRIPQMVMDIPTRKSKATHEVVFIAYLHPFGIKNFYVQRVHKAKRETKNTYESNGRTVEDNVNMDNVDRTYRSINDVLYVDVMRNKDFGHRYDKVDLNFIEGHINRPDKVKDEISDQDNKLDDSWNVFIDKKIRERELSINKELEELEKHIKEKKEERRKLKEVIYRNLNDDELRMLADDPMVVERFDDVITLDGLNLKLSFNSDSGQIKLSTSDNVTRTLSISFSYYPGCVGNNMVPANRSSGAYIFRPNATEPVELPHHNLDREVGEVVQEIRVQFGDNVLANLRVYQDLDFAELDWLVGPIDVSDDVGKEYVVKYQTDLINNGVFYTDSNGRQILKRLLNKRADFNVTLAEPIAGNYYPVTNEISIKNGDDIFKVLTDRSQGGSSLAEGELELMLHRRLLHDDAFGVDEALNETAGLKGLAVRGKQRLLLLKDTSKHVLQLELEALVFVSNAEEVTLQDWFKMQNCYWWVKELPKGLHVLTVEPWGKKLLLRLENLINSKENDSIEIDLREIFYFINVKGFVETNLAANDAVRVNRWSWNTANEFDDSFNEYYGEFKERKMAGDKKSVADEGFKVKVKAKQIRTFVIDYEIVN